MYSGAVRVVDGVRPADQQRSEPAHLHRHDAVLQASSSRETSLSGHDTAQRRHLPTVALSAYPSLLRTTQ